MRPNWSHSRALINIYLYDEKLSLHFTYCKFSFILIVGLELYVKFVLKSSESLEVNEVSIEQPAQNK